MTCQIFVLLTALSAVEVLSSQYHGPTALPEVLHNGYLADTHEVAAAKSAHLATLAHQSHGHGYQGPAHHGDSRYHGPTAIPEVLHDGHIADTHEVAAAKAEHFAAVAKARVHTHGGDHNGVYDGEHHGASGHENLRYHGPIAVPHVLHDGHIADTHEVAAAKAEHFAAVAKARVHTHGGDHNGVYDGEHHGASGHENLRYHGPTAIPHVLHDGHIADTHEVAAAKAEHFAAVAKARTHGGYGHSYSGSHHTPYHGPLFRPVVLHSGYLADTHEVAAAKQHHLHASHSHHHSH